MATDVVTIDRDELRSLIDGGRAPVLVEVLVEPQYHAGHLPGAINIPLGQLRERAPQLLPDKQADVVVYCGSFT